MSQKRKDHKGRVLRTGESQRKKDLIYQYRYTDSHGKRQTVYTSDLQDLRDQDKSGDFTTPFAREIAQKCEDLCRFRA